MLRYDQFLGLEYVICGYDTTHTLNTSNRIIFKIDLMVGTYKMCSICAIMCHPLVIQTKSKAELEFISRTSVEN